MKKAVSLALALCLVLTLASCGSAPQKRQPSANEDGIVTSLSAPVELQFWHSVANQTLLAILDEQIAEFNDTVGKEKGITVKSTFNGSSSELYSSVVAAIKAGNAPDVSLAVTPYVADYLQTDYVVNLEPYIKDGTVGMTDYEDIFQGLRNMGSGYAVPGVYSLPLQSYAEVLFYNVDFFEKNGLTVPTTWDEMIETSRKIHDITGAPAFGWDNLATAFMTMVKQYGGRYTDQNGNLYFTAEDSATTLEVLKMWQDNVKEGIWRTAGEDMFFSGPFANEIVPMYIGDSVEASYIPSKNPDLKWAAAPIPQVSQETAADLSSGNVIIALNTTGDKEREYASYEFIKFLTSHDANLAVVVGGTGYLPIRQSVVDTDEYKNYVEDGHGFLTAGVEQSSCYFSEPVFTNEKTTSSAVNSAVKVMMQEVTDNGLDLQTALDNLKKTVGAQ